MKRLDGKEVAAQLKDKLAKEIAGFSAKPGLAVVLVGEDPASQVYVRNKIKACEKVGIESFEHRLPADVSFGELSVVISKLNVDPKVDGILVQLPLPQHLNETEVIELIDPGKDVDGLSFESAGLLMQQRAPVAPCTPAGVIEILKYYNFEIVGKEAVVVGRSNIVGKPMALLLSQANATVTICHSKTKDLKFHTKRADIVVVAAGVPEFLGEGDFNPNAVVMDVGIHRKADGKLCGDVKSEGLNVQACTPVPGGVGPMTIAMLLKNTVELHKIHGAKK